jgi:hypothetical protein
LIHSHTAFLTITNVQLPLTNYAVAVSNLARASGVQTLSPSAFFTVVSDTDNDGMPDEWETSFRFDPGSGADRFLDADDDGHLNWEEYAAGTNPTNALSYLKLGFAPSLSFEAVSNKTYSLQLAPELNSVSWQASNHFLARPTNRTEFIQISPPALSNRFYRLVTLASSP